MQHGPPGWPGGQYPPNPMMPPSMMMIPPLLPHQGAVGSKFSLLFLFVNSNFILFLVNGGMKVNE